MESVLTVQVAIRSLLSIRTFLRKTLYQQEAFEPVASLYVVDTEVEAITIAKATTFGLSSSVYSSNIEHAKEVAAKMEAGMVFINSALNAGADVPFGGREF
ncbi:aldehyde dehydrogenase family domain-containing protein [Trichoderma barbatum]